MRIPFKRNEPGVWVSAATHVGLLTVALLSVAAPALPDAQEGVPVEVMTEQQFSELTKGERNADKPQPNAMPRADRLAKATEEREPENAKVDAPAPPKRPADMKVASAEEMPLRTSQPDPARGCRSRQGRQGGSGREGLRRPKPPKPPPKRRPPRPPRPKPPPLRKRRRLPKPRRCPPRRRRPRRTSASNSPN